MLLLLHLLKFVYFLWLLLLFIWCYYFHCCSLYCIYWICCLFVCCCIFLCWSCCIYFCIFIVLLICMYVLLLLLLFVMLLLLLLLLSPHGILVLVCDNPWKSTFYVAGIQLQFILESWSSTGGLSDCVCVWNQKSEIIFYYRDVFATL